MVGSRTGQEWSNIKDIEEVKLQHSGTFLPPSVELELSQGLGGSIQHFYISHPDYPEDRLQLISDIHPADSGFQWTGIFRNIPTSYPPYGLSALSRDQIDATAWQNSGNLIYRSKCIGCTFYKSTVIFNQSEGSPGGWSWGMANLFKLVVHGPNKIVYSSPENTWTPLYPDVQLNIINDDIIRNPVTQLLPYQNEKMNAKWNGPSPIFRPMGTSLLDGRVETAGVSTIKVSKGVYQDWYSQVEYAYRVRSHRDEDIPIKDRYINYFWGAYKYKTGIEHDMRIFLVDDKNRSYLLGQALKKPGSADLWLSSIAQSWASDPMDNSTIYNIPNSNGLNDQSLNASISSKTSNADGKVVPICSKHRCGLLVSNISRVIFEYQMVNQPNLLVVVHKPDRELFTGLIGFADGTVVNKDGEKQNSSYSLMIYNRGCQTQLPGNVCYLRKDFDQKNTVLFSVGTNNALNAAEIPLGYQ